MDDAAISSALADVHAAWLMDDDDEQCQANAIRHIVAIAEAAERERCAQVAESCAIGECPNVATQRAMTAAAIRRSC